MAKVNCWEWKKCGRQLGGTKVAQLGTCPAATERRIHGANTGVNGGRACWLVAGTLCGETVQGTFAAKLSNCMNCDFYNVVVKEEGVNLARGADVLKRLE